MKQLCLLYTSIFLCISIYAQENKIVLEGLYQGKNLYVKNPPTDSGFCTTKVLVNNKEVAFKKESTFEIEFRELGLELGDSLKVVIDHRGNCKPKVINEMACYSTTTPYIKSMKASKEGVLTWTIDKEQDTIPFIIEHFRWNKWVKVGELQGTSTRAGNEYEFKMTPNSGKNKVRIVLQDDLGRKGFSQAIDFDSGIETETFYVDNTKKQIIFSNETMYELYDKYGNVLKKGNGKIVDCSEFKKGVYYMNYDNKTATVRLKWKDEK